MLAKRNNARQVAVAVAVAVAREVAREVAGREETRQSGPPKLQRLAPMDAHSGLTNIDHSAPSISWETKQVESTKRPIVSGCISSSSCLRVLIWSCLVCVASSLSESLPLSCRMLAHTHTKITQEDNGIYYTNI